VANDRVPQATTVSGIGRYRWRICALLFLATTINYMDRSVLSVLAPTLQYKVFDWSDNDFANIQIAFKTAYAIGMLCMGAIVDRFGTRIGYTLAICIWSIFGMLHAAIRPAFGFIGFCIARFGLGFGESGNFPAANKTNSEWFPKKERALSFGIFNAGSNVGAILAPSIIPLIVWPDGTNWQFAFLTTGVFSAIWVILWLNTYRRPEVHPRLSKEELAYINSDSVAEAPTAKVPLLKAWLQVLPVRETWAFSLAKMTDAVWWFYLFWGGKFLYDQFGLSLSGIALPMVIIYVIADGGSVGGGWLSSSFIKRGWSVNAARKTALLICALCIMPVMFVTFMGTKFTVNDRFFQRLETATSTVQNVVTENGHRKRVKAEEHIPADAQKALHALDGMSYGSAKKFLEAARTQVNPDQVKRFDSALIKSARSNNLYWIAVLLIALAAAGHQAWSCNLFTLVSDVFPKKAIASVTGVGGMIGAVAGIVGDKTLGTVLMKSGTVGYFLAFLGAGLVYLFFLGVIHVLMPKMTPLDENLHRVKT
jgi:MFS transporter, ACS family, hexuronate transporter